MDEFDPMSTCTYNGQNCVVACYNQNPKLTEFIIDSSVYCWKSRRYLDVFRPLLPSWETMGMTLEEIKKTETINTDFDFIMSCIHNSISDLSLIEKIGESTYGFIKHAICSNKCINMEPCELIVMQNHENADVDESVTKMSKMKLRKVNCQIYQFKISYDRETEKRFSENVMQLYHGTSFECVRPIMCEGIRNCSYTKLMTTGAAYGNGIYLSNNLSLSLGYARGSGRRVVFIYDVLDKPDWKKADGIYVVPDETALILRYILVLNDSFNVTMEIIDNLNKKLKYGIFKKLDIEKQRESQAIMSKVYSKRLMGEYKRAIKSDPTVTGFSIELVDPDSLYVWRLKIHRVDNDILQAQMAKFNIPFIEIEITFPAEYPIIPPFVRIIHPHFRTMTGHITSGGSLCMEALSTSGWAPATSVEALIIQIRSVLVDGGAQIDESNFNRKYTMEEAREAFARAMAVHKW